MQTLIEHARAFPTRVTGRQEEFTRPAGGRPPQALFVSCSDARVIPSLFTGALPGDLFEIRTAGNIVPPYRAQAACAVAGSLEFAVRALQVGDIVVCGHSDCGPVEGLLRERTVQTMPLVRRWLTGAGYRPDAEEPWQAQGLGADAVAATQQHVLTQLGHLRSYPFVARRVASGRLRLHAWYYTVETGEVLATAPGGTAFTPL
ncbi:carbonic anhydrase [Streptomyces zinciresistens K42]|uniref:Carbonic anhydrase n=1 Tax=Streptomyces zinciresistens K42 TaxID=700597 RepID=G2GI46_9ACTN|nr:carbonic anhydrase [Streptomyces zinciresistens]EGX56813.1 carbonic anhydrase [Streptomyces zinciresistens K42]